MPASKEDAPNKLNDLLTTDTSASHSREKIGLCCEIILDHFGPVAAQVACTLLQRGRLTLRELSRFLAIPTLHAPTGYVADLDDAAKAEGGSAAGVPNVASAGPLSFAHTSATQWTTPLRSQRLIQQALLTLIQHNLCWHVCPLPDGTLIQVAKDDGTALEDSLRGTEYFQINVEEVLPRMRIGTYLDIAEQEFGPEGLHVVQHILRNGKCRVADTIAHLKATAPQLDHGRIEDKIRDLLFYGYVQPSMPKTHTSPRDRRIAFEAQRVSQSKKLLAPKDRRAITDQARQMLIEDDREIWFSAPGQRRGLLPVSEQTRKRKLAAASRRSNGKTADASSKKQKSRGGTAVSRASQALAEVEEEATVNGHANGGSEHGSFIADPTLFLRVNFDRFDVHVRDEMIVRAVATRYNGQLADLMDSMLQLQKGDYDRIPQAREAHSDAIHTDLLHAQLPIDLTFKTVFDPETVRSKFGSTKGVIESALLGEALAVLLGDGDDSSIGVSKRFIGPIEGAEQRFNGPLPYTKVQIEYANVARALRRQILRTVVESQFGPSAVRVTSLLTQMGKLDEKQISKLCLLAMSETRDVCARLFAAGILSLQEVPKASERTATRSYFFWYVDEDKCLAWLSDRLCKSLARLAQRRRHELLRESDLIDKASRTDTAHADPTALGEVERLRLKRVRETVEMFVMAENRTMLDLFVVANLAE